MKLTVTTAFTDEFTAVLSDAAFFASPVKVGEGVTLSWDKQIRSSSDVSRSETKTNKTRRTAMTASKTPKGVSRRTFLKTASALPASPPVRVPSPFPDHLAQSNITLRQFGTGVSNINAIAEQCKKDLGITLEMTATDSDAAAQRAVTQPNSYDIADIEYWILKKVYPTASSSRWKRRS